MGFIPTGAGLPSKTVVVSCKADVKSGSDGAMTSGSNVLTSPSGPFNPSDVGKLVSVQGAGTPATFTATTSNVSNPTLLTAVSSVASIVPGQTITGPNIPAGTTVVGIQSSTVVQISQAATGAAVGSTMTVAGGISGTITSWLSATQVGLSVNASTTTGTFGNVSFSYGSDDTLAVNAAVATAAALGAGAALEFPGGAIYCAGIQSTWVGMTISGQGPGSQGFGTTLICTPAAAGNNMITLGKWGNVENIGIAGGTNGIVVTDAFARIFNCWLGGQSTDGIVFTTANSVGSSILQTKLNNQGQNGINYSNASAFDHDIVDVVIGLCGLNGLRIATSDIACTNVHIFQCGQVGTAGDQNGVRMIGGVAGNRFTNCYFESNNGRGVYASSANCNGHSFSGSWFWRNVQNGVYYFTGKNIQFYGCAFWDQGFSTAGGSPALTNDTGTGWAVTGCSFYDDQGTKTQTFGYQELNTANLNTIVGNNMQAANMKTGSSVITGAGNVPVAASMGTLNNV